MVCMDVDSESLSRAQVNARATSSMWAYFNSVGVIAHEMNATGFSVSSDCFCTITVPKP